MDYKAELRSNNADIQALIEQARSLPDQIVLPTLGDPASEEDVLLGKEFIGADGDKRYGSLQPYAFTPGWEVMVPLEKTYDSSDVFLQMTSLSGFGNATEADVVAGKTFTNEQGVAKVGEASGGASMSSFYVRYPTGETMRYFFDPSVCWDWLSFVNSEYNSGRFAAGTNNMGSYCVVTNWDTANYIWYIEGTEANLDMPIFDGAVYTCTYWVP